jgi:hypothetical protein
MTVELLFWLLRRKQVLTGKVKTNWFSSLEKQKQIWNTSCVSFSHQMKSRILLFILIYFSKFLVTNPMASSLNGSLSSKVKNNSNEKLWSFRVILYRINFQFCWVLVLRPVTHWWCRNKIQSNSNMQRNIVKIYPKVNKNVKLMLQYNNNILIILVHVS